MSRGHGFLLGDVCCWHLADVQTALTNVRFEGNNGHDADVTRCPLMTQSGHHALEYPRYNAQKPGFMRVGRADVNYNLT